jgi:hypothetical protein
MDEARDRVIQNAERPCFRLFWACFRTETGLPERAQITP